MEFLPRPLADLGDVEPNLAVVLPHHLAIRFCDPEILKGSRRSAHTSSHSFRNQLSQEIKERLRVIHPFPRRPVWSIDLLLNLATMKPPVREAVHCEDITLMCL